MVVSSSFLDGVVGAMIRLWWCNVHCPALSFSHVLLLVVTVTTGTITFAMSQVMKFGIGVCARRRRCDERNSIMKRGYLMVSVNQYKRTIVTVYMRVSKRRPKSQNHPSRLTCSQSNSCIVNTISYRTPFTLLETVSIP